MVNQNNSSKTYQNVSVLNRRDRFGNRDSVSDLFVKYLEAYIINHGRKNVNHNNNSKEKK